jgi:hypothetical protein
MRSTLLRSTLLRSTQLLKLRSAVSTSKYTKLRGSGVVSLNREPERLLRDSEEYWRTEKLPAKVLCRVYTGGDTAVACLCVNRGDGGFPYNDLSFGSFRGGWGTGNGAFSSRVRRVRHVRRFGMTFLTRPDLGGPSHYSGDYLIGFEHCGAHFFDLGACLGGPSHASPLLTTQVEFGHVSVVGPVSRRVSPH